jgi:hypothetical protein
MSILELAIYGGLVINDGMTATGYIHYALDKKQNYTVGFGAEPGLMENTLK